MFHIMRERYRRISDKFSQSVQTYTDLYFEDIEDREAFQKKIWLNFQTLIAHVSQETALDIIHSELGTQLRLQINK